MFFCFSLIFFLFQTIALAQPSSNFKVFDDERSFDREWAAKFSSSSILSIFLESMFLEFTITEEDSKLNLPLTISDPVCGCQVDRKGRLAQPTFCAPMKGIDSEEEAIVVPLRLMPLEDFASHMTCFKTGHKSCSVDGLRFGGMRCCMQSDIDLRSALKDPNFFIFAPKTLVDRLNVLKPGKASSNAPKICGISIDTEAGVYSLPSSFDGLMSRMWSYASKHYGVVLSVSLSSLDSYVKKTPSSFEMARERMIRLKLNAGSNFMDSFIKNSRPSYGFKLSGSN